MAIASAKGSPIMPRFAHAHLHTDTGFLVEFERDELGVFPSSSFGLALN